MTTTPTTPPTQPTVPEPTPQDEQHLRLLSIFYYLYAGLTAILGCSLALVYVVGGLAVAAASEGIAADDPSLSPATIRGVALGVAVVVAIVGLGIAWLLAGLFLYTGRCIANRRHRIFCLVMAALTCLSFPLGTALGVYSFFALSRPGVMEMFRRRD